VWWRQHHACLKCHSEICQESGEVDAQGPSQVIMSVLVRDIFLPVSWHVFLLGLLAEESACAHGENMQTPHRKAREIYITFTFSHLADAFIQSDLQGCIHNFYIYTDGTLHIRSN